MDIKIFDEPREMDSFAARMIADTVAAEPSAVLGLATGSTPLGIYETIKEIHRREGMSFRRAMTFNLDEYVGLAPAHKQSYAYYMNKHLFGGIDILPERAHLPNGLAPDLAAEAARYDRLLAAHPIALQLLGLGHNGHIGFNEPSSELIAGTHVVKLRPETRRANSRFFAAPDNVPEYAITMGIGSILKARRIVLAVRGGDKADILLRALTGPISTQCPASLLQTHANVIVLADRDAGRKITNVHSEQLAYH